MERRLSRRDLARTVGAFTIVSSMPLVPLVASDRSALAQGAATAAATPGGTAFGDLGLPVLDLTVNAKGVEGFPASLAAGRYLLHLAASDSLPNNTAPGVFIAKMPSGVTMADLQKLAATPIQEPPDWYYTTVLPGGVSSMPGQAADAVIDLKAGDWFASGPQLSTPPIGFTVTGDFPSDLKTPTTNATITLKDYAIDVTAGALVAGQNLIAMENIGKLPHFLFLAKGPDSMTKEQVGAAISADMSGTPVASGGLTDSDLTPVLQSVDQSAGTTQWISLSLDAGTYAGMCWVPEPGTGVPHAAMGMYNVFTVK
ncbi:MAG: hypothetical protein ACTHQE_06405 [Thermomicrobiales bacterium]|jgi:hypothetical protein